VSKKPAFGMISFIGLVTISGEVGEDRKLSRADAKARGKKRWAKKSSQISDSYTEKPLNGTPRKKIQDAVRGKGGMKLEGGKENRRREGRVEVGLFRKNFFFLKSRYGEGRGLDGNVVKGLGIEGEREGVGVR